MKCPMQALFGNAKPQAPGLCMKLHEKSAIPHHFLLAWEIRTRLLRKKSINIDIWNIVADRPRLTCQ